MPSDYDLIDASKCEQNERALLKRISNSTLVTWLHGDSLRQFDKDVFMQAARSMLEGMQDKGLIKGLRVMDNNGRVCLLASTIEVMEAHNSAKLGR